MGLNASILQGINRIGRGGVERGCGGGWGISFPRQVWVGLYSKRSSHKGITLPVHFVPVICSLLPLQSHLSAQTADWQLYLFIYFFHFIYSKISVLFLDSLTFTAIWNFQPQMSTPSIDTEELVTDIISVLSAASKDFMNMDRTERAGKSSRKK